MNDHFAFGANWASYAALINEARLAQARDDLARLLGTDSLSGKSFLDIGCGSGLHAAAAAQCGVKSILATDIDPQSVVTAHATLQRFATSAKSECQQADVLSMTPEHCGQFDIVYSWGVLHHTGDMHAALRSAAALVLPNGLFAFALYRKTGLCWLWRHEKKWYAHASPRAQSITRGLYIALLRAAFALTGRNFKNHISGYKSRGMDFRHDVHDWLGGYPYESISPSAVAVLMKSLGFTAVRSFIRPYSLGIFGSGCDEYVYRRLI